MLRDYKFQAAVGVWGGIFFFVLGGFIASMPQASYRYLAGVIMAGGYLLFIAGCLMYAKGKGWNFWLGMLGVLGPVGLLFLYILRDKSRMEFKKRKKLR